MQKMWILCKMKQFWVWYNSSSIIVCCSGCVNCYKFYDELSLEKTIIFIFLSSFCSFPLGVFLNRIGITWNLFKFVLKSLLINSNLVQISFFVCLPTIPAKPVIFPTTIFCLVFVFKEYNGEFYFFWFCCIWVWVFSELLTSENWSWIQGGDKLWNQGERITPRPIKGDAQFQKKLFMNIVLALLMLTLLESTTKLLFLLVGGADERTLVVLTGRCTPPLCARVAGAFTGWWWYGWPKRLLGAGMLLLDDDHNSLSGCRRSLSGEGTTGPHTLLTRFRRCLVLQTPQLPVTGHMFSFPQSHTLLEWWLWSSGTRGSSGSTGEPPTMRE